MSLDEANRARVSGKYQEVLGLYRSILADTPENANAHEGAAICLVNLKDYAAALNSAKRALDLDSSLALPHLVLAAVYRHQRKMAESDTEINKAVELQPNSATVVFAQGTKLMWKNQYDDAVDFFMRSIEIDTDSPAAFSSHINLGYIYQQKQDFKQALQEYQIAYDLRPSRRLLIAIWRLKYRWLISIVVTILLFSLFSLSVIFDSGLLLVLFFLPLFLASVGLVVRYIKQKKAFWVFVTASISIMVGWLIYRILYTYFTK
jgi:tetratricopeptide (TPR) repeat protein